MSKKTNNSFKKIENVIETYDIFVRNLPSNSKVKYFKPVLIHKQLAVDFMCLKKQLIELMKELRMKKLSSSVA